LLDRCGKQVRIDLRTNEQLQQVDVLGQRGALLCDQRLSCVEDLFCLAEVSARGDPSLKPGAG